MGDFSMRKWESEKHKCWGMPGEGFKGHVATDGSLLGQTGQWEHVVWAVVQLDYGEEMGFCMGGRIRGSGALQEGGVDSLLCLFRKSMCSHQDSCGQQGNN